jgi:hypothetical protein
MANIYAEGQLKYKDLKEKQRLKYNTIDQLYWNDTMFCINKSPLIHFNNYDTLYSQFGFCGSNDESPVIVDKRYLAQWIIIDKKLYLFNVSRNCTDTIRAKLPLENMEIFLDMKFSKEVKGKFKIVKRKLPDRVSKHGVIPAVWFSDTLYAQFLTVRFHDYVETKYYNMLIFDKGMLIKTSQFLNY